MYQNTLMNLGLSDKEADVYETLLKIGPSHIPKLLKNTIYKRGDLYNILAGLESMALIEVKEEGRNKYTPVHPSKLQDILKEEEKNLEQNKKTLEQSIPGLNSMFNMISGKPGVRYFEGRQGFREALSDSLNSSTTIYTFVNIDAVAKYAEDINNEYVKNRQKRGIPKKLLILDTPTAREYMKKQGNTATDTHFLPKEMSPFKTGLQIYDNKISYFTLRENNIMAVIIEDKDIYEMHKNIFEFFWNMQNKKNTVSDNFTVFNN